MPIPKPGKTEEKKDFLVRCLSNVVMKKEYPDIKQRAAVCYKQWKDK